MVSGSTGRKRREPDPGEAGQGGWILAKGRPAVTCSLQRRLAIPVKERDRRDETLREREEEENMAARARLSGVRPRIWADKLAVRGLEGGGGTGASTWGSSPRKLVEGRLPREGELVPNPDDRLLELEIISKPTSRCAEAKRHMSLALEAFPCDLR
ncbi:hypothetical protein ZWY2020_051035 [Hordeum vulgare]|nr:hypothetical protein ZWY2020_051035 [Hordeum vulgare]